MEEKDVAKELAESKKKSEEGLIDNIKVLEHGIQLMKDEIEATQKLHKITEENPEVIEPEYKFQEMKEFWDAVKILNKIKNERNLMAMDSQLRQSIKTLNSHKEQLTEMGE